MFFVYILYSKFKNKYYIGYTSDELEERIRRHNTNHKGYTGGVGDWVLVYKVWLLFESRGVQKRKRVRRVENILSCWFQNIPT
jgi:putative endonuclease